MALGDIKLYTNAGTVLEARTYKVASGTTASINAGEPVLKTLGNSTGNYVTAGTNGTPVVGTNYLAGISATTSTETSTAAGTVTVEVPTSAYTFTGVANNTSLIATQALYDALVGSRVTFNLTNGVFTINLTDGSTNGLIVEPLDVSKYPNLVRFSIRTGSFYYV